MVNLIFKMVLKNTINVSLSFLKDTNTKIFKVFYNELL